MNLKPTLLLASFCFRPETLFFDVFTVYSKSVFLSIYFLCFKDFQRFLQFLNFLTRVFFVFLFCILCKFHIFSAFQKLSDFSDTLNTFMVLMIFERDTKYAKSEKSFFLKNQRLRRNKTMLPHQGNPSQDIILFISMMKSDILYTQSFIQQHCIFFVNAIWTVS